MASNISLFNTLDNSMFKSLNHPAFHLHYMNNGEDVDLDCSAVNASGKVFTVKDSQMGLRPDDYSLSLSIDISLEGCDKMYSSEGIALDDSELGYALVWKSHESKQRGSKVYGVIDNTAAEQSLKINHTFEKGTFRGRVDFSVVVYLKSVGVSRLSYICDIPGAVLGELYGSTYFFDGNGSIFPICAVEDPGNQMLWSIDISWSNPEEDSFSDTVSIKFNKSHKDYERIRFGSSKFDKYLFVEIISSAMTIVASTFREKNSSEWADMNSPGYVAAEGTVCHCIKYMIDVCQFDFTDAASASTSLRQYFLSKIR